VGDGSPRRESWFPAPGIAAPSRPLLEGRSGELGLAGDRAREAPEALTDTPGSRLTWSHTVPPNRCGCLWSPKLGDPSALGPSGGTPTSERVQGRGRDSTPATSRGRNVHSDRHCHRRRQHVTGAARLPGSDAPQPDAPQPDCSWRVHEVFMPFWPSRPRVPWASTPRVLPSRQML
jgi:hypothetical protein